ncbi:MAG TPA: hypothetical protein VG733_13685 [Chthoniobacteraceae bacterium]|nr:hypothetical protein [Chthoniobacteraceae bacterium]
MADTIQIVSWALQQSCKLRTGAAAANPKAALNATCDARVYSDAFRRPPGERSVYGNVCVTGYGLAETAKEKPVAYPWSGLVVPEVFREIGGAEGLFAMCANCPANVIPARVANCTGTIYVSPDSEELDKRLQRLIVYRGVRREFSEVFAKTTPVWFGLWTASPLSAEAIRILRILFSALSEGDGGKGEASHDFKNFLGALEIAEQRSIPLHVSLAPPGHTDFGIYTVFPHCPFCKAGADVERWKGAYPAELYTCEVCGTRYSPVETATREKFDIGLRELREVMGQAEFEALAVEYLVDRGASRAEAKRIVHDEEAAERAKKEEWKKSELLAGLRRKFLKEVIQKGLVNRCKSGNEYDHPEFDARDFAEVLARCARTGAGISSMWRFCEGTLDKSVDKPADPAEVLKEWDEPGCLFGAVFETPEEVLMAYAAAGGG